MDQLAADCALLEELRVMDYSLLLGVHYRSTGWMSSPPVTDKVPKRCTCKSQNCAPDTLCIAALSIASFSAWPPTLPAVEMLHIV